MAANVCLKCGARIPSGAAFCPNCGAPKAVEQPVQQPQPVAVMPQQMYRPTYSLKDIFSTIFSESIVFVMILLGVLLAAIGGLIFLFAGDVNGLRIGTILNTTGFVLMGLFLLMGGLTNKNFEKYVSFGMIVGGAIMITWSLSIAAAGFAGF